MATEIAEIYAHLNGDSQYFYATDANFPESGITGDMTIQAWVRLDDGSETDTNDIVRKFKVSGQYCYIFRYYSGKLRLFISTDGSAYAYRTTDDVVAVADTWQHVAVTYDASAGTCIFYLDGTVKASTGALGNAIFDGTSEFSISSYVSAHALDGSVYNVAIYDDIRTPTEITASYNDPDVDLSAEGNIVGVWVFDDDAEAVAIDNTQGDSGRDLTPYDGGDVTYENCGRVKTSTVLAGTGFGYGLLGTMKFGEKPDYVTYQLSILGKITSPRIRFVFDGHEYDSYIEEAPQISRGEGMSSGYATITLNNSDSTWNGFLGSDKDDIGKIARIGIYFSGVNHSNPMYLFVGTVEGVSFHGDRVVLNLRDRLAPMLDKTIGSGQEPISITPCAPYTLVWALLTTYGGLNAAQHDYNPDIDYDSWRAWRTKCIEKNYELESRFTGNTVQTALGIIAELTCSQIYVTNDGKVAFSMFDPIYYSWDRDVGEDNAEVIDLTVARDDLKNYIRVYYDFSPDGDTWTGSWMSQDPTSVNMWGERRYIQEGRNVWHSTSDSALSFLTDYIANNKDPAERINIRMLLEGLLVRRGNILGVTDTLKGMTGGVQHCYWVDKIANIDLEKFTVTLEGRWTNYS